MSNTFSVESDNSILIGKKKYVVDDFDLYFSVLSGEKYNLKVKRYPGDKYKKIYCNYKSFIVPFPHKVQFKRMNLSQFILDRDREKYLKEKEKESCRRSIEAIKDIARLNPDLNWFVTLTIDPEKLDSSSPSEVYKKLSTFLHHAVERQGLKYVLITEYHKKDEKLHFHGLFNGAMTYVDSGTFKVKGFKKPMRLAKIKRLGVEAQIDRPVFNIQEWKWGFSTAMKLENTEEAVGYSTKYLIKELEDMLNKSYYPKRPFDRRYFSSKNLERYPVIELHNIPYEEYNNLNRKEYGTRFNDYKYKYIDNFTVKK